MVGPQRLASVRGWATRIAGRSAADSHTLCGSTAEMQGQRADPMATGLGQRLSAHRSGALRCGQLPSPFAQREADRVATLLRRALCLRGVPPLRTRLWRHSRNSFRVAVVAGVFARHHRPWVGVDGGSRGSTRVLGAPTGCWFCGGARDADLTFPTPHVLRVGTSRRRGTV